MVFPLLFLKRWEIEKVAVFKLVVGLGLLFLVEGVYLFTVFGANFGLFSPFVHSCPIKLTGAHYFAS